MGTKRGVAGLDTSSHSPFKIKYYEGSRIYEYMPRVHGFNISVRAWLARKEAEESSVTPDSAGADVASSGSIADYGDAASSSDKRSKVSSLLSAQRARKRKKMMKTKKVIRKTARRK
jgi:hypothetical protein